MYFFVIKIIATMVLQLATLFRLLTGKYSMINNGKKSKMSYRNTANSSVDLLQISRQENVYKREDEKIDVKLIKVSKMEDDKSNSLPVGNVGITNEYVFQKKEDEKKFDMEFIRISNLDDIFEEWKNMKEKWT
ncbi:uncharacterized protein LOC114120532 isoform X2 [Aphis gossypii]|uniref:uncharacterized protein LOC114120532 isoform X2 n=1 Tax=Aphis gossypii TaxID=80765 RepID=UPI0021598F9A|nr:uncharacterized protein LOC114120532 isoform X2 [Aphis gossypii]